MQSNSFLKIWLLCFNFEKFASINLPVNLRCALLDGRFTVVNFSKLTHNNQIFRNDLVCNHYHLCKLSVQTIECKFLPLTISYSCCSIPLSSLIQCCYRVHCRKSYGGKKFALNNLSWNLSEMIMTENKDFPENLFVVR